MRIERMCCAVGRAVVVGAVCTLLAFQNAVAANQQNESSDGAKQDARNGVSTNRISLNKLAANKLAANKLAANKLAANKLAANKLAANKLAANKLAANKLAANQLATNSINAESEYRTTDNTPTGGSFGLVLSGVKAVDGKLVPAE